MYVSGFGLRSMALRHVTNGRSELNVLSYILGDAPSKPLYPNFVVLGSMVQGLASIVVP